MTLGSRAVAYRSWRDPAVVCLGLMALAAGFGQFGAVAALGQVAKSFGHATGGATLADQAGLSGTALGLGLAVLRAASLGGLVLTGLADRFGRRRMTLLSCALGLAFTALAALSPGYWWFVAIFALGRPLLSTTSALAQVGAAEETASADRAKAIALVTAGYAVGSGLTAILHGVASGGLGFRGLFALSLVPLLLVPVLGRGLVEPDRFLLAEKAGRRPLPVLGAVALPYRRRFFVVVSLAFFLAVVSGPATSFVFLYAENVLKVSGAATALMVVVAGAFGLVGLLQGRWLADHVGRRVTGAACMVAVGVFGVVTYGGSRLGLFLGYELTILAAATFAPAAGALANELFPTSVRASMGGWNIAASVLGAVVGLLAFGALAEAGNRFSTGALVTFLPVVLASGLFFALPETRGKEPEEVSPEAGTPA